MRKYIIPFNILFFFICQVSICQTDKEKVSSLLEKSQKVYNNFSTFYLPVEYNLYANYQSKIAIEKYDGFIVKKKTDFYSKIQDTEFVSLKDINLKIDNESKLIGIGADNSLSFSINFSVLKEFLNHFNKIVLSTTDEFWVCTLSTPEITFVPYHKIILYINKKDNLIYKQELFLLNKSPYKDKTGKVAYDYPKLVLEFGLIETSILTYENKFQKEHYIKKVGNRIIPSAQYSQYTIVD